MASALTTYKKAQANDVQFTDSPHELIRIVFRVLLENLSTLQEAVTADSLEWQKPFQKCSTALSILRDSLDFENGGEIASNLDGLYAYSQERLFHAVGKSEDTNVKEVQKIITEISSAWSEITDKV